MEKMKKCPWKEQFSNLHPVKNLSRLWSLQFAIFCEKTLSQIKHDIAINCCHFLLSKMFLTVQPNNNMNTLKL